jgi:4-phospho-D-threonate 3-dehydrogenase / 4-phospho-D-erythronate 3-dehydrogenase
MMLGVTMGDAAGVGPEIMIKSFRDGALAADFVLVGDRSALDLAVEKLGWDVPVRSIASPADYRAGFLNIIDLGLVRAGQIRIGQVDERTGAAARAYIVHAAQMAMRGELSGLVTLPVNKEAIRLSDCAFTGHTELIAQLCGVQTFAMMLRGEKLITSYVSTHVSMAQAVALVKQERVLDVIRLTCDALKTSIAKPGLAVAGLNAHAGEHGSFGCEDQLEILPAIRKARAEGIEVSGPHPADTVFLRACNGHYDAVVCMYHDQGHIPQKLLEFDHSVNVTLGLPFVRTSVDHGTAFDIAYRGIASNKSFVRAFQLVAQPH